MATQGYQKEARSSLKENLSSPRPRWSTVSLVRRPEFGPLMGAVLLYVIFASLTGTKGWLTTEGTASWANVASQLAIVAVPVGMLLICGEFDLSIGAVVATSSVIVSYGVANGHLPFAVAACLALLFGCCVGVTNALVLRWTRLPSFVVTLATWYVVEGGTLGVSRTIAGTSSFSMSPPNWAKDLLGSTWAQFDVSILWALAIVGLGTWILSNTRFGNWIYATGGDEMAARNAGVPTDRVRLRLYLMTALGACFLGILQAVAYSGGNVTNGETLVFDTIIAAVIGGALLQGGYGSVIGIALGAVSYGLVSTGVYFTGWDSDYSELILGVLLAVAVLANHQIRALALKPWTRKGQDK
jgi:simple sugar transport system permease protein